MEQNETLSIMENVRQNITSAFNTYYSYSYGLVNNETRLRMSYKQQRWSPWINNFVVAGTWLNDQENHRLNLDNIEHRASKHKWVFVKFPNIVVKAVLDRQPLLGTGSLPDWLRNLARGRVSKNGFDGQSQWHLVSGTALLFIALPASIGANKPREKWQRVS